MMLLKFIVILENLLETSCSFEVKYDIYGDIGLIYCR